MATGLLLLLTTSLILVAVEATQFYLEKRRSRKSDAEEFARHWFAALKRNDEVTFFTQYLDPELDMKCSFGFLFGQQGFKKWYYDNQVRYLGVKNQKLTKVNVSERYHNSFNLNIERQFDAVTQEGRSIHVVFCEEWDMVWDDGLGQPNIYRMKSYCVEKPIASDLREMACAA